MYITEVAKTIFSSIVQSIYDKLSKRNETVFFLKNV
jgi:hypothetical protein